MKQCGAKTRTGEKCRQTALANGRCRFHGGKSLAGIASPTFQDGSRSKYVLPPRLRGRYDAAMNDPALLEQRREIALIDARLGDLLGRVDTGESGALWAALMGQREELIAAKKGNDAVKQILALNTILDLISQGHTDHVAWRELGGVLEQRRKLVESERKRLIEMQQVMTSEQAMLLMNALLMAVKANVSDRSALNAIQSEFLRLTDARDVSTDE